MTQLTPIELDDGTVIYIEATGNVNAPQIEDEKVESETPLVTRGEGMAKLIQKFKPIEGAIKSYTVHTLNAFKEIAAANVDKVTLEFGITVGGEAGIPYVTKGTAESNLKITVECSFPQ